MLCGKIRQNNAGKWYLPGNWSCRLCMLDPGGNVARLRKARGYRGCGQVNDWYDKLSGSRAKEKFGRLRSR